MLAQLTSQTQVVVSIGGLIAILGGIVTFLGTLIGLVWKASNELSGIRKGMEDLAGAVRNCWTNHDQERYCYKLEKANRKIGLVVPNPVADSQHGAED